MHNSFTDDQYCALLIRLLVPVLPDLVIQGGADEPFYKAATDKNKATLYFRDNYPRSLLHELAHYCLAGDKRRTLDDFGYWYSPCGRSAEEQKKFEAVEARPQGLEKVMCEIVGLKFSPSTDDFSGRPASECFLLQLATSYDAMKLNPPHTALKVINGLKEYYQCQNES